MTLRLRLPLRAPALPGGRLRTAAPLGLAALLLAATPAALGAAPQEKKPGAASATAAAPAGPAAAGPATQAAPAEIPPFEVAEDRKAGIWFGRFGLTNCSWIDMGDGIAVIDTGASEGDAKNLVAQIAGTTSKKPVRWLVLTHLHGDSNSGLPLFLGPDVTIFVHERSADGTAAAVASLVKSGRRAAVVGVSDRTVLSTSTRRLELIASPGPAHSGADLMAFLPDAAMAWVGDLVTPMRCPMTSDPQCDPWGWTGVLSTLEALHPATIVATRGDASLDPTTEIGKTKGYLIRLQELLAEFKAKGYPEARVSGELSIRKLKDYCPVQLDAINALSIYRRLGADGKIAPAAQPERTTKVPKK